jgi:hypothetical protein
MEAAFGRRGDNSFIAFFADAVDGVKGFLRFAAIAGNDENFAHGQYFMPSGVAGIRRS